MPRSPVCRRGRLVVRRGPRRAARRGSCQSAVRRIAAGGRSPGDGSSCAASYRRGHRWSADHVGRSGATPVLPGSLGRWVAGWAGSATDSETTGPARGLAIGIEHRNGMSVPLVGPGAAPAMAVLAMVGASAAPPVVTGAPSATPAAARAPVVRTRMGPIPRSTVTVPFWSVRSTRAPAVWSRATVAGAGWPYGFPRPAEITASDGRTAARNASVDDVLEP